MFDFLKKKLKESVEKISKSVIKAEKKAEIIEEVKEVLEKEEEKLEQLEEVKPKEEVEVAIEKEKEEPKDVVTLVEKEKVEEKKKEGLLSKIKKKVTEKEIKEEELRKILWDLRVSLMESDVAANVAEEICNNLEKDLVGKHVKRNEVEDFVKGSLKKSIYNILNVNGFSLTERIKEKKPFVIVFLGFNGSGKTTAIAKLGYLLKQHGLKCVFAAADTWRAASIEQLEEHGRRLGIAVIKQSYLSDPAAVIFDAVKHAKAAKIDVVLADTAGRSHVNVNLIDELKKIIRVNKPDLKILILDALTGNDIYDQAKLFNDAVGVDALILTKADVYDKGGAAISASHTINKPLLYLGVGQEYKDLIEFKPNNIVESLFQ